MNGDTDMEVLDEELSEGEVIDGGAIQDLDADLPKFDHVKHHAQTASRLAFYLVWLLIVSGLLHYSVSAVLLHYGDKEAVQLLTSIFDKWLPVVAGFVGGAVTYYFTKEGRR